MVGVHFPKGSLPSPLASFVCWVNVVVRFSREIPEASENSFALENCFIKPFDT